MVFVNLLNLVEFSSVAEIAGVLWVNHLPNSNYAELIWTSNSE